LDRAAGKDGIFAEHIFCADSSVCNHLSSLFNVGLMHGKIPQEMHVMQAEIPSGMCAKLRTMAASNNRDHASQSLLLLLACSTHTYFCSSRTSRSW